MKIRTGFVSNSSSSSFVIFVTETDYNTVLEGLSNLEKDILKHVTVGKKKAFDRTLVEIGWMSGNYSTFEDYSYGEEMTEEEQDKIDGYGAECIMDEIQGKLSEFEHISHEEDM